MNIIGVDRVKKIKKANYVLTKTNLNIAHQRLKERNEIDGLLGARTVGTILDSYNENVEKRQEKNFNREISARNKYYLPLWKAAIADLGMGELTQKKNHLRKI